METMSFVEIAKLIGQGGFPVLFAFLLMGLGWMGVKLGPQVLGAWTSMITAINELKMSIVAYNVEQNARNAALTAKLDSMERTLEAMRQQDVAAAVASAAATGSHSTVSNDEAERLSKPGQYNLTDRDRDRRR
jgi:cobalamin-dependent methionine synthase I